MILPETKATKTANTMDSTAISFFGLHDRLSGWTRIIARKLILITDKIPEEIE